MRKEKGVSDENNHSPLSRAQPPTRSLPDMLDEVPKADDVLNTIEGHCQIRFQPFNKTLLQRQRAMIPQRACETKV